MGDQIEIAADSTEAGDEEHSDRALVRRTQAGDRTAFERLARRYLRPVHAVAASFLAERADIEDVAQETFLRAIDAIDRFDSTRPFAPWLYQIARNVARNRVKWRRRHPEASVAMLEESIADDTPSAARRLELAELRDRLASAIDGLPEQRRTVFRLVDVDGYAPAEAATLTPEGMVTALHLDSTQEARVRAVLDSLHGDLARAAQSGADSLISTALQGRRRLEAALPPERRQSFRTWMQQHHATMMQQMGGGTMGPGTGAGRDTGTAPGAGHMKGMGPGMMRGGDSGRRMMPRRP